MDKDVVIGALYHLLKPRYKTELLLDDIETSLGEIALKYTEAVDVLAGDLNTLWDEDFIARTSLNNIVSEPTVDPANTTASTCPSRTTQV